MSEETNFEALWLELAADYLVMAAWLAYLKSRLLLPEKDGDLGPSAEDMATALALRLRRLEAIRNAAEALIARPQLGRDVFSRGAPEPIRDVKRPEWTATLYDLLSAYAAQRQKHALARVRVAQRRVWSLAEVRPEELRLLEALLFASAEPLDEQTLTARMPDGVDVAAALDRLQRDYA